MTNTIKPSSANDRGRILLLGILYFMQGVPFALFGSTIPILFKKYLTYQQIGIIQMSMIPFTFKVFYAPLVDFKYSEKIGKRKTWLLATQIPLCFILLILSQYIEQLLLNKQVYTILLLQGGATLLYSFQDIAVDAWAVELVHPSNQSIVSSLESVAMGFGFFIGGTAAITLTSQETCQRLFGTEHELITLEQYFQLTSLGLALVTLYIIFNVNEKTWNQNSPEEEFKVDSPVQVIKIAYSLLQVQPIRQFLQMCIFIKGSTSLFAAIGDVYLTNDLSFPKEQLTIVSAISTPVSMMIAILLSKYEVKNAYKSFFLSLIVQLIYTQFIIFGIFYHFEGKSKDQEYTWSETTFIQSALLIKRLMSTVQIAFLNRFMYQVCDRRFSGFYMAMIATINNSSMIIPKLYIYWMLDNFGLYISQGILILLAAVFSIVKFKSIIQLNETEMCKWWLSDESVEELGLKVDADSNNDSKTKIE